MVLEEGGGPRQVEANTQGVAMTTLQAATARQCHTEKQWRVKYLPHIYHAKRDGQGNSQGKVRTSQGISATSGCGNHVKVPLNVLEDCDVIVVITVGSGGTASDIAIGNNYLTGSKLR
ncbi:unnamed protein product [Porites lobata]|uniref:Uncharacterized protein n=1 Tax=Porites lobata TaxID=104759 RepID=A0ABN8QZR5_9CNID|nr:unnamed protein product [Porites lobata]